MKAGTERKHTPKTFWWKNQTDPVNHMRELIRENTDETQAN